MSVVNNLVGKTFDRLTVLQRAGSNKHGGALWSCSCTCGSIINVSGNALLRSNTKSCGCLKSEGNRKLHGLSKIPEYAAWVNMRLRCTNTSHSWWEYYGGRGISVCQRWLDSFENFYSDMGQRPGKGYSIDRVDNYGNYEPSNCRWATAKQQNNNTRFNKNG